MKRFVSVRATFEEGGNIVPEFITWDAEHIYPISKVIDIRYKKLLDNRAREIKFTCVILGKIRYLYYDERRWYVKIERAG